MPSANFIVSRNRVADDDHDHNIDSTSSTPPGAVTPKPDFTDKRFPGIIHSCVGQVGTFLRILPPASILQKSFCNVSAKSPIPQISTMTTLPLTPPLSIHSGNNEAHLSETARDLMPAVLSPPLSVPERLKSDKSRVRSNGSTSSFDFCLETLAQNPERQPSKTRSSKSSSGYNPTTSTPNSGVVAYTSALATLVSKSLGISSNKSSSSSISSLSRNLSQSDAAIERQKLTGGVVSPLNIQNTPPQTPRTRSQEDNNGSGMSSPSRETPKSIPTDGTTVGPVLGKLTVTISEGRGLRPSLDPYVVCEFQLSQDISESPVSGQGDGSAAPNIAIKPSSADRRRPMAIPMKSRQSSSSGRDSNKQQSEITNPRWNHKAVL
jgi:hypothetical protein